MTNPITLKEQVRELTEKYCFTETIGNADDAFDALIDQTTLAVLQMVEEGLPEEKDINADSGAYGWNAYRTDFLARISALKDSFSGEGV